MPETIQNPHTTDELVSAFDLMGRPRLRLEDSIMAVHVLHDHLWANAAGWANAAAAVGFRSIVTLINPLGINRPMVLDRVIISAGVAGFVLFMRPNATIAGLTASTTLTMRDFRRGSPSGILSTRNNAAAPTGTTFLDIPNAANERIDLAELGITLSGGPAGFGNDMRNVVIMPAADNVSLLVNAFWREPARSETLDGASR